jgi:hypothetical protein
MHVWVTGLGAKIGFTVGSKNHCMFLTQNVDENLTFAFGTRMVWNADFFGERGFFLGTRIFLGTRMTRIFFWERG